ncbi:beta strand repeat-containing protein, partial [Psychroserpens sp.]
MKRSLKHYAIVFMLLVYSQSNFAQVGIGNTDPKAILDITASNQATPSNTDGILIPRIDNFPITNPTAAQQGMIVYLTTTSGGNPPGFYYWDNGIGSWASVTGVKKINNLTDGKTDFSGRSIFLGTNAGSNDSGASNDNVGVGFKTLNLNISGTNNTAIGNLALNKITGNYNTALGSYSLNNNTIGQYNTAIGGQSLISNVTGEENTAIGTFSGNNNLGSGNIFIGYSSGSNETGSNKLYIENRNNNEDNALVYGEFDNNILRVNGELQLGTTIANRYFLPTARGTANQILQTNGAGQLSFRNPDGTGTDDQNLQTPSLTGTTLNLYIQDGTGTSIDLAPILDGTGTDNQGLQLPTLTGTTLNLNIENGAGTAIDLAPIQDGIGTDNQNISGSGLSGTDLTIGIENGTSQVINLASLQDGTGTDDQTIDTFSFNTGTNVLTLEVENDGVAAQTVNLSTLQDGTGTDDQTIDTFSFNTGTNVLTLEVENDGVAAQTVNLSSLNNNDADWYEAGTTSTPNAITDDIYTQGKVAIGTNTPNANYNFTSESNLGNTNTLIGGLSKAMEINTDGGATNGLQVNLTGAQNASDRFGIETNLHQSLTTKVGFLDGNPSNKIYGIKNDVTIGNTYEFNGVKNYIVANQSTFGVPTNSGFANDHRGTGGGIFRGLDNKFSNTGGSAKIGVYNTFSNNVAGNLYGTYSVFGATINSVNKKYGNYVKIPNTVLGTHYGYYADVTKADGYAAYYLGRVSIGTATTNNYLLPLSRG